jgi:hypothetical protein
MRLIRPDDKRKIKKDSGELFYENPGSKSGSCGIMRKIRKSGRKEVRAGSIIQRNGYEQY